ncbi:dienelactone hydrolase family protein [Siccirubricoccus sp. G192]|uniref:dienelactone hydrolase family protein n=1 Tax=Siccirubricoccus sp. G192 TaxID=2849651 RepID=UPI001C2C63AB|nr:dienelactone hydrolase family protein [Siccirubricoccus sp. G192]MBV1797663.1 dienelactone hydrolase family protein [Siccirubricoccus sp. G192]
MTIELTTADGHTLSAYTAGPRDASRALVVVQEIFGVNRHMRRVCDDFAKQGYAVICPALFDRTERGVELGYEPADVARGRKLRGTIKAEKTVLDIRAAAAALPKSAKRGIVGYCWGGTVAWHGATRTSDFAASVGWYGGGIAADREEKPHCPVQLHFGEKDASIPMSDVEAVRAARPEVEIFVYKGAGHGFGCEERGSYVPADAALAQERTLAFFAKHLG